MAFFCRREITPLALSPMFRKGVVLKIVSKLVLKKLLNYAGFDNVQNIDFKRAGLITKKGSLM